jgi:hypothetical protein
VVPCFHTPVSNATAVQPRQALRGTRLRRGATPPRVLKVPCLAGYRCGSTHPTRDGRARLPHPPREQILASRDLRIVRILHLDPGRVAVTAIEIRSVFPFADHAFQVFAANSRTSRAVSSCCRSTMLRRHIAKRMRCAMNGDLLPPAAALQELVTPWRVIRQWTLRDWIRSGLHEEAPLAGLV